MRKILYLFLFSVGLSLTAQAQTTPQEKPHKTSPETSQEKAPTKEASKPEKSETAEDIKDSIDLDSFFKKGEENAKNGSSCNKPSTPVDPVA